MKYSPNRRTVLLGMQAAAAAALLDSSARAQDAYPTKPIHIVIGFGAGGTADTITRMYAEKLSGILGQPVLVENRPGARQMAAIQALQQSAADGYTLYAATKSSLVQNPALMQDAGYDPLKDFSLVGIFANINSVLAASMNAPFNTIPELIAYAREHPDEVIAANAGVGSADHLWVEAMQSIAGIRFTSVPFTSGADATRELAAGRAHLIMTPVLSARPFFEAGQVKGIAVSSPERQPLLPDVPGLNEVNADGVERLRELSPNTYIALAGPAGMPEEITNGINAAINEISQMPDIVERCRDALGAEPAIITSAEFHANVGEDIERWKQFGIVLPN